MGEQLGEAPLQDHTETSAEWQALVDELKSLRRKRGLTFQAIARCQHVLAALNSPPLQEAVDRLSELVYQLGEDERALALRNAYALGMAEPKLLTNRRADLQIATGRDLKTIASCENQMIEELASRLIGETKPEVSESEVIVVGHLKQDHLVSVTVTVRFPLDSENNEYNRSVQYENRSHHDSLPALMYQLPHDWHPRGLRLAVIADEDCPLQFWASPAIELLDLMFGTHGGPVPLHDGLAAIEIEDAKPGVLYTIYWTRSNDDPTATPH